MKLSDKMNYKSFKGTYPWTTKSYPHTTGMFNYADCIKEEKRRYKKHGSRWVLIEDSTSEVSAEFYMNVVEAVPFFRRLGTERVSCGYTKAGYLPVEISSYAPDKTEKIIRKYSF